MRLASVGLVGLAWSMVLGGGCKEDRSRTEQRIPRSALPAGGQADAAALCGVSPPSQGDVAPRAQPGRCEPMARPVREEGSVVESRGVEPLTSTMPLSRSTS